MTALRDALLAVPVPGEENAGRRAHAVLAAAHAEHWPGRPSRRRHRAAPLALIAAALTATAAIAAAVPGSPVRRWLASVVDPGPAQPLERLPAGGRLLVVERGTARLVDADGTRHDLGRFADATWSPHGLFVAGVAGDRLVAVAPDGAVHWSTSAGVPAADPRWGPDGYRVAYRAGPGLRVVAGDGSGDHLVAARVAPVAPAWRPDTSHVLAYATATGVRLVSADAAVPVGRRVAGLPRHARWIGWAGHRLVAASSRRVATTNAAWTAPRGTSIAAAAVAPDTRTVAVLLRRRALSRVALLGTQALRARRTVATVAAPLRDLVWAPDGRWLASAPAHGTRWLLLPLDQRRHAHALRGAARPRDWCCAP